MTTPSIKPVRRAAKGHNRYCGPAALSIISGIDTAEAAAVIRFVGNKASVKGTSDYDQLRALNLLGFSAKSAAKVDPLNPKNNPTLAAWLRDTTRTRGSSLFLIAAGNHWQVVQGRRYCCGLSKEIVSIRDEKVKRRARVTAVYEITQDRKVALADVLPARAKTARVPARERANRLAKQYDIEIETERCSGYTSIIVWGPSFAAHVDEEEADPFYGDHTAEGWQDALERVEAYVDLIRRRPELVEA